MGTNSMAATQRTPPDDLTCPAVFPSLSTAASPIPILRLYWSPGSHAGARDGGGTRTTSCRRPDPWSSPCPSVVASAATRTRLRRHAASPAIPPPSAAATHHEPAGPSLFHGAAARFIRTSIAPASSTSPPAPPPSHKTTLSIGSELPSMLSRVYWPASLSLAVVNTGNSSAFLH